ncbi:MAG: 2-amino-4-hydroxy-6-hydroxymethyldihydropteridine diphosphokinase [Roseobacter sp.]
MPQGIRKHKTGESLPQFRSLALIALGSNEPFDAFTVANTVNSAIDRLEYNLGVIRSKSRLFNTPAFPKGSGPDFVNAAVAVHTDLDAQQIIEGLHRIESEFGRARTERWGQRTLDLDLIGMGDLVLPNQEAYQKWAGLPLKEQMRQAPDQLILPHPRVQERAFVLIPLMDVAADWIHPVSGLSVSQMVDALPSKLRDEVKAL